LHFIVIASAAKQSSLSPWPWIASSLALLAMTLEQKSLPPFLTAGFFSACRKACGRYATLTEC
jgi:hypothetical protein